MSFCALRRRIPSLSPRLLSAPSLQPRHLRFFSTSPSPTASPFQQVPPRIKKNIVKRPRRRFKPLKPACDISPSAVEYLSKLCKVGPEGSRGVMVKFTHSTGGQPRMVFSLSFINENEIEKQEELGGGEIVDIPGSDKILYVHSTAFLKVLGSNVEMQNEELVFLDKEGFKIDPSS
ncbi:hypothetical protein TrVE_jg6973 [Triparma verrucosa]|uniref:Uncharacterized protein n=1 Tax=Triparma verrucosa TaxID=1606542 RepID=A0A9W7BH90_9STRA|nr:hypothetical protein TrVE_jg6973 [Triparma verrucosa]